MSGQNFPRVPVNPRLEFGAPLDQVCERGVLHPGLRELFLKAYLSAGGEEHIDGDRSLRQFSSPPVLQALKPGPKGQGLVSERISLKSKLEIGKWIVATQTPAGAPLWLLRHFLGRLPRPLLQGSHWRMLAVACGAVSRPDAKNHVGEVLERIVLALEALPPENYLTLAALVLLIRNLSAERRPNKSVILHEEALAALSQYFTASIISRPYRPGLYTPLDKEHKPLLVFLSEQWLDIKELCQVSMISYRRNKHKPRHKSASPGRGNDRGKRQDTRDLEGCSVGSDSRRQSDGSLNNTLRNASSHCNLDHLKSNHHLKQSDLLETLLNTNFQETNTLKTVQAPKGVDFGPYAVERIRRRKNESHIPRRLQAEIRKDLEVVGHRYSRLNTTGNRAQNDPEEDEIRFLHARKIMADGGNDNPKFDVKKLIKKYETVTLKHSGIGDPEKNARPETVVQAKTKIDGTQTFECEFLEELDRPASNTVEVSKEVAVPSTVRITESRVLREKNTKSVQETTKDSSTFYRFFKTDEKRATIPLTKSTAMLVKNFAVNEKEVIIFPDGNLMKNCTLSEKISEEISSSMYRFESCCNIQGNTESVFFSFPNSNVSTNAFKGITVEPNLNSNLTPMQTNSDRDVKNVTNPPKETNFKKVQQKKHSFYEDFVSELKSNFKNGRKKPSQAKLMPKLEKTNENCQQVVSSERPKLSKALKFAQFLRGKAVSFRGMSSSSSVQELIPKRSYIPISPTNSI